MSGFFRYTPMRMRGPLRPLASLIAALDVAAATALVGLVSVMVSVVAAQVVLRYVFNSSLDWADELSRLCFVWSIFLAIPLGLKTGSHIGIQVLASLLPPAAGAVLGRATALTGACLMLLVAWESAAIAWDQWDELLASIPASAAWFIVPLVLAGLHAALHLIWQSLTGAAHRPADLPQELH